MSTRGCRFLLLIFLLPAVAVAGGGPETEPFYYYSDGERVPLVPSPRHLALRFALAAHADLGALQPALQVAGQRDLTLNRLTLVELRDEVVASDREQLMSTLRQLPEIELVARVFRTPDALMIVADQFIAAFPGQATPAEVTRLADSQGVEVVRRLSGPDNVWVLRVPGSDALAEANRFHGLPGVLWAHPDFVRVVDRGPRPGPAADETVILGPDGRRLAPDTPIPKGASGYRSTRPLALTLPEAPVTETAPGPHAPVAGATIVSEDFEGTFPNANWAFSGTPTWDDTSYRAWAGSWSGYGVGSSVAPPGPYPNNANAWMVHGPFSLVGGQDARLDLQAWIHTEVDNDLLGILASINGSNFYGNLWSGDWASGSGGTGWMNIAFDLKQVYTLGDLRGQPTVWVALVFQSNGSIGYEGVYVDDVVIEKITGGYESLTSDVYDHLQWSLENNQQLWGIDNADIDAMAAWGVTHGSDTITVAVIDEGVDLTHPDLAAKLVSGYDATGGGSSGGPSGDDAHGTNCAGIAAAVTANGAGVAGIAREAKIMPVRIAYGDGAGGWITSDAWLADGINWAWTNGADVLSNSWGGGSPATVITNAIAAAKTSGRGGLGSVVFFASGNDNGPVSYPATLATVQAIGALSPCDERKAPTSCDGEHWWGSNYGSELDLTAPGVHMYSTDIQGAAGYDSGDYFYDFNGTSSATPVAAGVAALMLGHDPSLTATQVESALAASADDLNTPGWDSETGHGRINAYEALMEITPDEIDWGDAPDPTYPTLAASNGASHLLIPGGPFMGASVDAEPDGQPTANADGDDLLDGNDDEDGVTFTTSILPGDPAAGVTIDMTGSPQPCLLNAWIDFNIDGDWLDPGEQIFVDVPVVPGLNPLTFAVPADASTGSSFARFRCSTQGQLPPDGPAPDGEVEDVIKPECHLDADCSDGLFCNGAEVCSAGTCQPGTAPDCGDAVSCTVDACNEATDSCDHTPDDALCDNGLFCDGAEICDAVNDCQPGTAPDCSDGSTAEGIIIDHTCTDISQIPEYWIEQAKQFAFHYAHTSHGYQITSGLTHLESSDPTYALSVFYAGSTPPTELDCTPGDLCIFDGNPPDIYVGSDDYWQTSSGVERTEAVTDTGLFDFSMFSFCGEMSRFEQRWVQLYLGTMAGWDQAYGDMRFILMTGHTDGGGATLAFNNDLVRQFARDHDLVFFDFADIETYDPLGGGPYDNEAEGGCTWCVGFCAAHPEYCTSLPSSCAHSDINPEDTLFCKLKGQAFWWMLARLAGWPGPGGGDGVSCTVDTCNEATDSCDHTPDDALCDNALFCDGAEICDAVNDCQPGTTPDCGDSVSCTVDACNETTDACDHTPDDALCDNALFCDGAETCDAVNDCQPGTAPDCNDGVGCTDDSCDEVNDACLNPANDANCPGDTLFCNGTEFCDPALDCASTGDPCPAGQLCDETIDICGECLVDADCDDALFCNGAEACVVGVCQAATAVDCDDGVSCTVDACNEATDSCDHTPDDAVCDNALFCDGTETCDAVSDCQAGTAPDCGDAVSCTVDACNETTDACDHTPDDAVCDNGQFCDGTETCDAVNDCQPGTAIDCSDGVGCTDDSCDEVTDACLNPADDANCPDDALFCNGTEFCDPALDCSSTGDPCPAGQLCDETIDICGECLVDADCDDALFCNGAEACVASVCQAGTAVDCDDGVSCTVDACDETTDSCDNTPSDALCDNALFCDGAETCDAVNDCQAGTAVDCGDAVSCTIDACNETVDACDHTPDDAVCDNALFCDGAETCDAVNDCQAGTAVDCGDAVSCTIDACNETVDTCDHTPDDAVCDNALFCDGAETCDAVNDCQAGTAVDCGDAVSCTIDACNETVDTCDHTPDDAVCDNALFCDGAETCDAVNDCQPGTAPDCGDAVSCTVDACNETTDACDHTPDDAACDNALFCDGTETCDAVNDCQPGTAPDCGDAVSCTVDACNETTDSCDNAPNDALCDNALFCDGAETCDAVNDCQPGTAIDCSDGVGCTDDSCDEVNDACLNTADDANCPDDTQFCNGTEFCDPALDCSSTGDPCPAGQLCDETIDICGECLVDADCDDALFCNGAEACVAGLCQAGTAVDCDDGVSCTVDACNETTDACDHTPDDAVCDNGQFCDGAETCDVVNDCQPGTAPDCGDAVNCTVDACNEATDACDHTPDDAVCDNGQFCDGTETCDAVNDCQAGTAPDCSDGVGCTEDSCDEVTDACLNTANDANCPDDTLFCNGTEFCDPALDCSSTGDPCLAGQLCDETIDICGECLIDADCDDALFCNGAEACVAGLCQAATAVDCDDGVSCTVDACNEATDSCDNTPVADLVLSDDTILTTQVFDACSTITIGPNWAVVAPGNVTLRAGVAVIFLDDTMVGLDAQLTVEVDPSFIP